MTAVLLWLDLLGSSRWSCNGWLLRAKETSFFHLIRPTFHCFDDQWVKKWYLSSFIWNSCEKLFSIKRETAVLLWLDFGLFQYMDLSGMRIEGEVNFTFLPDRAYSTFFWYSMTKVVVFLMFILEFLWEIIQY